MTGNIDEFRASLAIDVELSRQIDRLSAKRQLERERRAEILASMAMQSINKRYGLTDKSPLTVMVKL